MSQRHITPFTSLNDPNPVGELLEMIWRRGHELMRQGGGPLERGVGFSGHALPDDIRREMRRRIAKHDDPRDVAAKLGVHYQTVMSNTRDIRTARKAVDVAA